MKIAEELLKNFPVGRPPFQVDVKSALQHYIGRENIYYMHFTNGMSGGLFSVNGRPFVLINLNQSKNRIHWTEAHELAEFLLHYDTIYEPFGFSLKAEDLNREKRANMLAAEFLMPEKVIRAITADFAKLKIPSMKEPFIREIARKFSVSEIAVKTRLKNLKINIG